MSIKKSNYKQINTFINISQTFSMVTFECVQYCTNFHLFSNLCSGSRMNCKIGQNKIALRKIIFYLLTFYKSQKKKQGEKGLKLFISFFI